MPVRSRRICYDLSPHTSGQVSYVNIHVTIANDLPSPSENYRYPMNKQEFQSSAAVGFLYLVRMLGLFMILPVLPIAAASYPDATPWLIGLAAGIYGLSQALLQIPLGILSDRWGRKPILFGALGLFVLGSLIAGLSDSLVGVVMGRLLQGCGAIASTLLAMVSDLTRSENRSKAMAIVGSSIGLSFGIAMVLGPWLYGQIDLGGLFLVTAALGVAGLLIVQFVVPTPVVKSRDMEIVAEFARLPEIVRNPGMRVLFIGIFFTHYLLMSLFLVLPSRLVAVGYAIDEHSMIYLLVLLASLVTMAPLVWLADKQDKARQMSMVAIGLLGSGLAGMALGSEGMLLLAVMIVFFAGFNALEAMLPAHLSRVAPAGARGSAMGIYATCQFGGVFAGGALGGLVMTLGGDNVLLVGNVLLCVIWMLIMKGLSNAGNVDSHVYSYDESCSLSVEDLKERLSSQQGVIEVRLVPQDRKAYLKVDTSTFDENKLRLIGES